MDLPPIFSSFNHWLGPLMAIGPLKIALLAWIALTIGKKRGQEREVEPAPEMPAQK